MTQKRLKTHTDCLRALNRLFNEIDKDLVDKDKAHQKRLCIMACDDIITRKEVMDELNIKEEQQEVEEFE